jgi:hypothetical protein
MTSRSRTARIARRAFAATAAIALVPAAGLATSTPAQAGPRHSVEIRYHPDATELTGVVGRRWVRCEPPYVITEGTVTPWYTQQNWKSCL